MLVITFNEPITVTMSLVFSVHASFALPDEFSRTGVYGSTFFDLATLLKSPNQAAQAPAMSTIMFISVSNSPMVLEKKIVSTASLSCLPIILLSGSLEIHLVSRVSIVGSRADFIRLMGSLASVGFLPLFQTLSLGYFNFVSDYLKFSAVSRI